jgi:oligosaccharyltransferase complex subunit gamma
VVPEKLKYRSDEYKTRNNSSPPRSLLAMRLFGDLIYALLLVPVLGAKKPATDRFQDFHSKSLTSTPLKLADSSYDRLTKTPRDYSVAVLLTALEPRFGCQLCREFQPEWDLLAKSWTNGDKKGESRLIYGTLDFVDGKDTFLSVRARLYYSKCTC